MEDVHANTVKRARRAAELRAEGIRVRDIADGLSVSERTVQYWLTAVRHCDEQQARLPLLAQDRPERATTTIRQREGGSSLRLSTQHRCIEAPEWEGTTAVDVTRCRFDFDRRDRGVENWIAVAEVRWPVDRYHMLTLQDGEGVLANNHGGAAVARANEALRPGLLAGLYVGPVGDP